MTHTGCKGKDRVLLGLAVSALSLKPGETRTAQEIAWFCDCRRQNIDLIEKRALKKVRKALKEVWPCV